MSERLALYLLGPPKLELNDAPVVIDRRKTLALLAYLGVDRWQHHRDQISALFWPEYTQRKAFSNLRHVLWEVRQAIGDRWIDARRDTIGLTRNADIWLDVADFEARSAQGLSEMNTSFRIPLLTQSVKLYRNHFLTGFSLKGSPDFSAWTLARSEDLRRQLARVLAILADDLGSSDQAENAIPYAQLLVGLDPLNEVSHCQLMQIYLQVGQHNAALRQYQICEKILRKELGIDPQPETRSLYKQIRRREIQPLQPVRL
jgi:DNA-binding SARP family transcriptional activator